MAFPRRWIMKDGTQRSHPAAERETWTPQGELDESVTVIGVADADNALRGCVVNFTCHGTTGYGAGMASADWIAVLRADLQAIFGPIRRGLPAGRMRRRHSGGQHPAAGHALVGAPDGPQNRRRGGGRGREAAHADALRGHRAGRRQACLDRAGAASADRGAARLGAGASRREGAEPESLGHRWHLGARVAELGKD